MSWFRRSKKNSQTDVSRLVSDLAVICEQQNAQLRSGQEVLSLSVQSLQLILAAFADTKGLNALNRSDAERRISLQQCLKHVRRAKLFGTSATLQGRIDLSVFESLTTLSLFKVPMHLIDMSITLRRQLEVLVCTRSLTQLAELLKVPRGSEFLEDSSAPDSNRLAGESHWDDHGRASHAAKTSVEAVRWAALSELHVQYNTIESLDGSLFYCTSLRVLDLSHNGLKQVGDALLQLGLLEHVDLSYNFLTDFPRFSRASQRTLRSLALHYNVLERLDSGNQRDGSVEADFRRYERLVELNLAHNLISGMETLRPLSALKRLSHLATCGNPIEFSAAARYRARVLASAVAPHCAYTLMLDGVRVTGAEVREAERIRCAGASLDERRRLEEEEPLTDVEEPVERVLVDRGTRSECESPVALASAGPNAVRKRRKRHTRPVARGNEGGDESGSDTTRESAKLVTKAEINARREQLSHVESASWLNALPQRYQEALDVETETQRNASPNGSLQIFVSQPSQVVSAELADHLNVIVNLNENVNEQNSETDLGLVMDSTSTKATPMVTIVTDDSTLFTTPDLSTATVNDFSRSEYSTPAVSNTVNGSGVLSSVPETTSEGTIESTPTVAETKMNGEENGKSADVESVRSTGLDSTGRVTKRRVATDAPRRKRSMSRSADDAFIVTPINYNSSLGNASVSDTMLFLIVNLAVPERGVQLLDVNGGEPIETFDLRKLRYAARMRDSSNEAASASADSLSRTVALAFDDAAYGRVQRRCFEMESNDAASLLLARLDSTLAANCSFTCVACKHTFVWLDHALVRSDRPAPPSSCPRCGGQFVNENSQQSSNSLSVQKNTSTRTRKRSTPLLGKRPEFTDEDSLSLSSFPSTSLHADACSTPLGRPTKVIRAASVKQFAFDEESFALVDSDLKLLFTLSILEQDEDVQLLFRCFAALDVPGERAVPNERNRLGLKKQKGKMPYDSSNTLSSSASRQQLFTAVVAITMRRMLVFEVRVLPERSADNATREESDDTAHLHALSDHETVRLAWQCALNDLANVLVHFPFNMLSFSVCCNDTDRLASGLQHSRSSGALLGPLFNAHADADSYVHLALHEAKCFEQLLQKLGENEQLEMQLCNTEVYQQEMTLLLATEFWPQVAAKERVDTTRRTRDVVPVCVLQPPLNDSQVANLVGQLALFVVSDDLCVLYLHGDACPDKSQLDLPVAGLKKSSRLRRGRKAQEDSVSFNLSAETSLASSVESSNSLPTATGAFRTLTQHFRPRQVLRLTDLNIDAFGQLNFDPPQSTLLHSLDVLRLTFVNEAIAECTVLWLAPLAADGTQRLLQAIGQPWRTLFGVPLELHPFRLA